MMCCLCRERSPLAKTGPNDEVGYVNLEATDLPGSGWRCVDVRACRERVREIVQAHVALAEACSESGSAI